MTLFLLFLILLFSSTSSSSSSSCFSSSASLPSPCLCAGPHSLVCSCSSASSSASPSGSLRLSASALPDQLHQLVVHSCAHLLIPSGTFRGKTIKDQMKFLDIGRLELHSGALRGIRRSPRLLLLRNSHLPSVPPLAFAGLAHVQHFWWRNVTIGRIRAQAFAKMAFLDYLYFHNVHIHTVDSDAFGHIHRLGRLFFRDRIRIDRMASGAFRSTQLDEFMVEGAKVKAEHWVFGGMRARKVRMGNCWWEEAGGRRREGRKRMRRRREETRWTDLGEVMIRNCTVNRVPFLGDEGLNVLRVEHSTIGTLERGGRTMGRKGAEEMENSGRRRKRRRSTEGEQSDRTNTEPTSTDRANHSPPFRPHHLPPSSPHHLHILHSHIRLLTIIPPPPPPLPPHPSSSSLPLLRSVLFRNSSVLRWSGSPFAGPSPVGQFLIEDSRIVGFGQSPPTECPFGHINASGGSLRFVRSQISQQLGEAPFRGSTFGILEMDNCRLGRAPTETLLEGMEVRERMTVKDTQWPCGRGDGSGKGVEGCGMEEMLMVPSSLPHWQFNSNQCFVPKLEANKLSSSSPPSSHRCEISSTPEGFVCRRLGSLEECLCRSTPSSSSSSSVLPLPSSSARILLIGDCPDHFLLLSSSPNISSSFSSLHSLYIFRVRHLIIRSVPPSLRHLNILHSSVSIANPHAFAGSRLFEFALEKSHLTGRVGPDAFRRGQVDRIQLEQLEETEEDEEEDGWKRRKEGTAEGMMTRREAEAEGRRRNRAKAQAAETDGMKRIVVGVATVMAVAGMVWN